MSLPCRPSTPFGAARRPAADRTPPLRLDHGRASVRRFLIALATLFVVLASSFGGLLAMAAGGRAAEIPAVSPATARAGALLLKGATPGAYVEAPAVRADYDVTVSGSTQRTRVTQAFVNPGSGWIEGVYVYPLPENGAVDAMRMVVGGRVVVAEIKERAAAKAAYEQAKRAGQAAALTEQERPNMFTNSVANIGPGETVVVQIEYQAPVRRDGDVSSLRIPLVVGPRYAPAAAAQVETVSDAPSETARGGDPVPDRDRVTPPVLDPATSAPRNPVTITVRLQAGFPVATIESAHHAVHTEAPAPDQRVVTLDGPVAADRDFELSWTSTPAAAPSVGLFRERVGDADYLLAYVTPPAAKAAPVETPREAVFVIDNSGSMGGPSMAQAKASLAFALRRLKPDDRFNVIRFDDTMDMLFADALPATEANVTRALRFVEALQAQGGTEMLPALKAALNDPRPADERFLRQIVFLTDGAVADEQRMFDAIAAGRGRSRLFMVGIGSAPNSHLMSRAAELGRGTFTHIGSAAQVKENMRALFGKLESPAVTNLSLAIPGGAADMTPAVLPDLYRGEPLVMALRLPRAEGAMEIRGAIGGQPWRETLNLADATPGAGVSKLWARRKIDDAEIARTTAALTPDQADAAILRLALEHHLVTRLTSLVAVDATPRRAADAPLDRADVPLNLPAGWDFETVFGPRAPAAPMRSADLGEPVAVAAAQEVSLPQTATDAELRLLGGLGLLGAALLVAVSRRRERRA
ncbi:marine proteobacterial sortase target protein [Methylopila sp. 73B]|uniref:marine proteobacterial sortase target protein n=1 Tax=Methylopila sp. 73B TaxID=1120792 RepID=UPI00037D99F8|nr:marine proteobacterial sortase target protein [Methylopila sp. 73B]